MVIHVLPYRTFPVRKAVSAAVIDLFDLIAQVRTDTPEFR